MENGRQRDAGGWVMFATILASSMAFIDGSALNVALPSIQSDLGSSGAQLLWFVNGYTLMLASLILLGGTLGDKLGRKRVFFSGILIFTAGSATCAASPSSTFLILARLLQGGGGALMVPGSLSIISSYFPPDRRGTAIGTWSAATTITTAGGPVLGGVLAQAGLWRLVFLINVPLGVASMVALLARVPESSDRKPGERLDLPGALVVTAALAALSFGFISAPNKGFGNILVILSLVVGGTAAILFVLVERRSVSPMVPLAVFRNVQFTGANFLTLFLYGSLTLFSFFLPLTMVQAQGYSEARAGLTLLPFALLLAGMSRWMGRISDRFGPRVPLIVGPLVVGTGFLLDSFTGSGAGPHSYWTTYFPGIVLFGLGMGTTVAPLTTTVMSAVDRELSGTASGINNAVSRVAGVLFLAILGSVALLFFRNQVLGASSPLGLNGIQRAALARAVSNLGNTSVPASISGVLAHHVARILDRSFIATFRLIMYVCTGCAWASALCAAVFLRVERAQR